MRPVGGSCFALLPQAGQAGQKSVNAFTVRSFLELGRGHRCHRRLCLPYGTQQRHRTQSGPAFTQLLLHSGAELIMLHDPVARCGGLAVALDDPGPVPDLLHQLEIRLEVVDAEHPPGLNLRLVDVPSYSLDFNADEAIWGWVRADATGNLCLGSKAGVQERVGKFSGRVGQPEK